MTSILSYMYCSDILGSYSFMLGAWDLLQRIDNVATVSLYTSIIIYSLAFSNNNIIFININSTHLNLASALNNLPG